MRDRVVYHKDRTSEIVRVVCPSHVSGYDVVLVHYIHLALPSVYYTYMRWDYKVQKKKGPEWVPFDTAGCFELRQDIVDPKNPIVLVGA